MVATLRSRQAVKLGARARTRSAPAPAPAAKKEKKPVLQAAEAFVAARRNGGKRSAKSATLKVYSPRKKALRGTRNGGVEPKATKRSSSKRAPLAQKSKAVKKDSTPRDKGETASSPSKGIGAGTDGQYAQYVSDMKAYFADVDSYDLQED